MEKLVFVGMPTFNKPDKKRFFTDALDSILAQTYKNIKIFISDNDSLDDTEMVCREYTKKDNRIYYVRQKGNRGEKWNINFVLQEGLKDKSAEYFMWACDDDLWDKTFIEKCVKKLEKDPEAVMVLTSFERFDEKDKNRSQSEFYVPEKATSLKRGLYERMKEHIFISWLDGKGAATYGLWRTKKIVPGSAIEPYWGSDMNFNFRNLAAGPYLGIDDVLYFKRTDYSRPETWSLPKRIYKTLGLRLDKVFSPFFIRIWQYIFEIQGLSFWQKVKLSFFNFLIIFRLFLRRKI